MRKSGRKCQEGQPQGGGTVCFLNLGNVLAALTIISCEPLAGRLWQTVAREARCSSSSTRTEAQ